MRANRTDIGRLGEQFAAEYVERCLGWRVVARNWRTRRGELDLVALDGETLVMVEVRTRQTDRYGTPEESVDARKVNRLLRVARQFVAQTPGFAAAEVRFDLIAVDVADGMVGQFRHVRRITDDVAW
ncbi:UPF0102 protein [Alicyclobacillus cellulosilyticus]|uniref:UPF0102 protein GCM10010885_00530 n=1 Tax=Alicyclobacillus cellulosilyticus TaxID=1003997 RepID=A0A917NF51_9BACL|nr:YraN family protein [Alicyclobacillus cellulosilyticus]GGI94894.1 UPF0102 protein [Alicyclobacillus cellulosilyticus]